MRLKTILPALALIATSLLAGSEMTVYKSKYCGCCANWIKYMENKGYNVNVVNSENMDMVKKNIGVPIDVQSCHTAIIDGYIVEGHVPAEDVEKMLKDKPDIKGIAAPGMPIGSPGMEQGPMKEAYDVVTFDKYGRTTVYAKR